MPAAVVSRLNGEMIKAAQLPDVNERLSTQGATVVGGTPQQALAHIETEIARWAKVVKAAGVKGEQ
jgi:tripartite-type tricarboxylate transporter receptor subunit TctC